MATITFDTLDLVRRLKDSGIPQGQAEAIVGAISLAQDNLVTQRDLKESFQDFNATSIAPIRTDLAVMKWMMGLLLASVLSLVLKAYF